MLLTELPTPAESARTYLEKFSGRSESPLSPLLLATTSDNDLTDQNSSTSETLGGVWGTEDSERLYGVRQWGDPYFSINERGHICVKPQGEDGPLIDLYILVQSLQRQGLQTPCLFRFPEIVHHRLRHLQNCFDSAVLKYEYSGKFQGVFPVKCNHSKDLIDSLLEYGHTKFGLGLEAGSKAELVMAMSMLSKYPGSNLICNGYKDAEYIELILQCRRIGINAIIILEQIHELEILLAVSKRLNVEPVIGVRARLTTRHGGHWGTTSGDRAKFGLRPAEIVSVVEILSSRGLLHQLKLLHFHAGSQITNIRVVKEAMQEAAYMFAELKSMGAPMSYLDVGGGLAIDYDGSKTDSTNSLSYTTQQYANDVVATIKEVCTLRSIPVPTIISESGRALASHHAVMVFDVLTRPNQGSRFLQTGLKGSFKASERRHTTKGKFLLMTAQEALLSLNCEPTAALLNEAYADAAYFKEEALRAFKLGVLSLQERAEIDRLFDLCCRKICEMGSSRQIQLPKPLLPESRPHSLMYHINFSVFRSAPDIWAIGQLFPIMPLHRLEEEPTESATLADITCDSDGKIDKFPSTDGGEPKLVLPLHEPRNGEEYLLGMFLGGVYQEVMGSNHNMLGTTHAVHVRSDPNSLPSRGSRLGEECESLIIQSDGTLLGNGFIVDRIIRGENTQEVLRHCQHEGSEMLDSVKKAVENLVSTHRIDIQTGSSVIQSYAKRLTSYAYLTSFSP